MVKHNTNPEESLLSRVLKKTGVSDLGELKKIFQMNLGSSREGRKILNSNEFSWGEITAIRKLLGIIK